MKTRFTIYVTLFFALIFSEKALAQRDAGNSSDGSCIIQPPPVSFKRNNGGNNGNGTCGMDGQIHLKFSQSPTKAPVLIGLLYADGTPIDYIYLPIYGDVSELAHKGYISYCLPGGNIDPAKKVIAIWHYDGGCQDDIFLSE